MHIISLKTIVHKRWNNACFEKDMLYYASEIISKWSEVKKQKKGKMKKMGCKLCTLVVCRVSAVDASE
jgi:hypothetical protein